MPYIDRTPKLTSIEPDDAFDLADLIVALAQGTLDSGEFDDDDDTEAAWHRRAEAN